VFPILQAGKNKIIQLLAWKVCRIKSENTNWDIELPLKDKQYYSEVSENHRMVLVLVRIS